MGIKKDIKNLVNRTGKPKPIICKKCGHKVGYVRPKIRFRIKLLFYICVVAFLIQFITQLMTDYLLFRIFKIQ